MKIERLLPGGVGLAHAEGLTLFVPLAAPEDVLRVTLDRVKSKVAYASIVEIIKPSPLRVEPPCPYFGRCGGCDFQHLNYESQLQAKVEIIRDCLYRIAHIESPPPLNIEASVEQWRYRSRANWQVSPEDQAIGYFERGSHRVCDVEFCAVLRPELQDSLERLRLSMRNNPQPQFREMEAVAGDEGVSLYPLLFDDEMGEVCRQVGTESFCFDARTFFQINHYLLLGSCM